MARSRNQKLKLLYLMDFLLRNTDDEHYVSMSEILNELKLHDIVAERKSIYSDIELLRTYGLDIVGEKKGSIYVYYVGNRDFQLPELKLLVDAVQCSKFITAKKTNELIEKIEGLTSKYEAKKLQREVQVSKSIKTVNENIYYNVDEIHSAIGQNRKIKFQYFNWNADKEMEIRRQGAYYYISPWILCWDDENYYLIGYDDIDKKFKHYRVDKMLNTTMCYENREGKDSYDKINTTEYIKKRFSMYDGIEQMIKIEFANKFIGVVIDRFGRDVSIHKKDNEYFIINVEVAVSNQFIGWIIGLGDGVKVVEPQNVVEQIKNEIKRLMLSYNI